jgi:sulfatase maturation enzyme AslB (radical SAM superfamily)
MSKHCSVEPLQYSKFSATWELTLKCNLDCSYCGKENHDNSVPHPSLDDCKQTVDFFIEYMNLYMEKRPVENRIASIDIFGGESLFHPDIVTILDYFEEQHKPYKDKWSLALNTVTNAVVKEKIWERIVDKINYWTVSYHVEATEEQLELVRNNILDLQKRNKQFHVSLLMHPKHWDKCLYIIDWCKERNIRILPRQIDHAWNQVQFWYSNEQADWMREYHGKTSPTLTQKLAYSVIKIVNLNNEGRQCCGGSELLVDGKDVVTHVDNTFKGWTCGVNNFFVYVKQQTKEIFTNKDCQVNFNGEVGPIGYVSTYKDLIKEVETKLNKPEQFSIQCVKKRCLCGLCTPKAQDKETYNAIISNYYK